MYKLRHYLLVWQANGTISQCVRWFGPFDPEIWTPVQMWDQRGQWIRQPYPDPPGAARSIFLNYQPDVWFIHWISLPEQFRWVEISSVSWQVVSQYPYCFLLNGDQLTLRPGHRLNETRDRAGCEYDGYVKRSHTAFGGMPVYQIRKEFPKRTPDDFPVMRDAGLFHPWYPETEPVSLHPLFRAQQRSINPREVMALPVEQRQRIIAAPAVAMTLEDGVLQARVTHFVRGIGAN